MRRRPQILKNVFERKIKAGSLFVDVFLTQPLSIVDQLGWRRGGVSMAQLLKSTILSIGAEFESWYQQKFKLFPPENIAWYHMLHRLRRKSI